METNTTTEKAVAPTENSAQYPTPAQLRSQADAIERSAAAVADSSEYPRAAAFTCRGQIESLRAYADTVEAVGKIPAKRPGMTGEERRERRADILRIRAARLKVKASDGFRRSHDIGSRIPFGQPILVGHHSERGHRRAIEKMHNADAQAYSASKYAEELERRARSVERRPTIQASDSDAVDQYRDKLARLIGERDKMKATNNAWRKYEKKGDASALHALNFTEEHILRMKETIATAYSWEKQPYAGWALTNIGARIRDIEKKVERLAQAKVAPEKIVEANGVRLEDCPADNRVRLFFPGKPDETTRTNLKRNGFRWSPSVGCWQAYRNWHSMEHAKTFIEAHKEETLTG
jgi:hypothetical protein